MKPRAMVGCSALLLVGGFAFIMSVLFVRAVLGWGQP